MFIFHRTRSGATEVFSVLVAEGALPRAAERFGEALKYSGRDERYHEAGLLVLIHEQDEVEYVLTFKDGLSEEETSQLDIELEHLAGRFVHSLGGEPIRGWYLRDSLKHE